MDSAPIGTVSLALVTAVFASLFAAADAAVTSLPEGRLEALAEGRPDVFARVRKEAGAILSRWLIGRIACISVASALLHDVARNLFGNSLGPLFAVLGAILAYGTSAEILCTLARTHPDESAAFALRWLRPLEYLLVPIAAPFAAIGRWVGRRMPERADSMRITRTEVKWAVDEGARAGALDAEPAEMIRNVLAFKDRTAREVMVPRRRVTGIEADTPAERALEIISSEGHSRYPVYQETLDHVIGVLYTKDVLERVRAGKVGGKRALDLARRNVLFVTESQGVLAVLREMRSRRLHLAVVSDDFGGTAGIVTLEDVIEEIVGEIHDEYDTEVDSQILKIAEGRFVADAAMPLTDLEPYVGRLPADGNFESLGGLMMHRMGRVPGVGAVLALDRHKLIVREADEKRIVKVEIVREEREPPVPVVSSS